ncbi:FMN-binding protein [Luteolibacter algae]|uniref:FMN-binding protein n=1 Tax=Luteolibacter algae TaxID=454151 RepID=A0ABW5D7R1_9BACT
MSRIPLLFIFLLTALAAKGEERVYKAPSEFIRSAFGGSIPRTSSLTLSKEAKDRAKAILQHEYAGSRVRYWANGDRSVWILEEIGKTLPITTGFVVSRGKITSVEILIYRESHGWEVSKPFFTRQFQGATLENGDALSKSVTNIAGATLSVRAVTKLSRLAIYFDSLIK